MSLLLHGTNVWLNQISGETTNEPWGSFSQSYQSPVRVNRNSVNSSRILETEFLIHLHISPEI